MPPSHINPRLPPAVINGIVRKNFGLFRICYEAGLSKTPRLGGLVQVRFVIDESGATTKAEDFGSDLPDPEVVACIVRNYSKLSFPPPEGGSVTIVYPIHFSPGDEPDAGAEAGAK